jgi:hypothetical protein
MKKTVRLVKERRKEQTKTKKKTGFFAEVGKIIDRQKKS